MDTKACMLQSAVGRHEECPGSRCPFWDRDGCGIETLRPDIESNPELAAFLLDLRSATTHAAGWDIFRLVPVPRRNGAGNGPAAEP
jgi:hypothetical protein